MDYLFRFDKPRPNQGAMVNDIYKALTDRHDIFINAPTGLGKTDASLGAALTFALKKDLDVFFLTPKISQHRIAMEAVLGIKRKFGLDFSFADIVGKRNICINDKVNAIESDAFYGSCESLVKAGKCTYFSRSKNFSTDDKGLADAMENGHNALLDYSYGKGVCAYEIAAKYAKNCRVIIAGYSHLLNPYNSGAFLKKIGHSIDNAIIIWDEAHNLINIANSYLSTSISELGIDAAERELKAINNSIDLDYLKFAMKKLAAKKLSKGMSEALVDKSDMSEFMESEYEKLIDDLEKAGLEYIQAKNAKRSSILHIARFLRGFLDADESAARIIKARNGLARLNVSCLYPDRALPILQEAYANVFMSATMEPMRMYSDMFKVANSEMRSYASPFPKHNKAAFIDNEFTTKFSQRSNEQYMKMAKRIEEIKDSVPGSVAVFFPSFSVLEGISRHVNVAKKYVQRREMQSQATDALMKRFTEDDGSMLMAVMGGSFSEGIDYKNNSIKGIIIVGIPLTAPDLELKLRIAYLDKRFEGRGMDYAYIIPAIVRSVQAAGRAVRSERDRAVLVFMDKRYSWRMYMAAISNSIEISDSKDYMKSIRFFWDLNDVVDKVVKAKPDKNS
ncbi:ATP-dependent DNA helicase [Candidatus Micrarchaeum sp.]|uniref:ATP-dependent DNA helicase n=1 Tax=Candidatus Micrarchaeum sp. TaxID=2282148 RepID=UPI001933DBA6|nr:ATP-dependent DNA helicase [Candidatus Micrarchaeum sp.]QRF74386.1 ATP-dependent DNA helicase [Candidatus Micrarchaeum sp.]